MRYKYIDALRGIAIIMVVMSHSAPYFAGITNDNLPGFVRAILDNGDKGVTLFFLMSAFTLCLSFDNKKDVENRPVRNYFLRRIFRIVPMYYFTVLVILLVHINSPSASSVTANILFLHGLSPNWINSTVPGGWSVGIEVLFYMLFPLLFFKIMSASQAINLTLACLLVSKLVTSLLARHPVIGDGITWGVFVYENIISQLPVFLIGVCLYHIQKNRESLTGSTQLYISYLLIAFIAVIHLLGGNIFKEHYLFAIAFGFLAYGLSGYQLIFVVNKFTVWTGKLSYSIYLVHLVVGNLLNKYHLNHYATDPILDVLIRFTVLFLVSAFISYFTYRLIEIPSQKYGKRLISKLEARQPSIIVET